MKETGYLFQAVLIALWWIGLCTSKVFFEAFQFESIPAVAFWAFLVPDLILIAGLSVFRAFRRIRSVEFVILGATAYPALYCLNATILTSSGFLSTNLMFLAVLYNIFLMFSPSLFRNSKTGTRGNTLKTIVQVFCVWSLTLVVFPFVILRAFEVPLVPQDAFSAGLGAIAFAVFSGLGLISAYYMVRDGGGTPLPLDQTNQLVSSGPYRYVRNPMAIAGIGQGIAVAIIYQSIPILFYSGVGAIVWQYIIRPEEERDLHNRFGEPYAEYRRNVRCWVPRLSRR